jgi:hypothetical protein
MSGRTRKMMVNGQEVEATLMSRVSEREYWNEYTLEDGTVFRLKAVVTGIWRIEGQTDQEGKPIYVSRCQNVTIADSLNDPLLPPHDESATQPT